MSEPSLHRRYLAGEHRPVWDELARRGAGVREGESLAEALAVVREAVDRSHRNLRTIRDRLVDLGYEFENPEAALVEAGPEADDRVRALEARLGTIPLLIREWYLRLASVDFSQSRAQERGPTESDVGGLGFNGTLIVQGLDEVGRRVEGARRHREDGSGPALPPSFLPLGPYASNCEPMGFRLPSPGVDGVLYNDGAGDVSFVDHLRSTFEWGGFPFWRASSPRRLRRHVLSARPNLERVLPLLRDGLLEI